MAKDLSQADLVVAVFGAGTMGRGIAQVCAQAGIPTLLSDAIPGAVEKAIAAIDKALAESDDGVPLAWKNEQTPAAGVVTPQKTYVSKGMKCRDLLIANTYKTLKGEAVHTFCQNAAGKWKLLN